MKIVKDKKIVKMPKISGGVKGTFKKAMKEAQSEKWSKVIIIGEGKNSGSWFISRMTDSDQYGILEKAKFSMLHYDRR